jgi:polar amino acid transport system substrate-binding protein
MSGHAIDDSDGGDGGTVVLAHAAGFSPFAELTPQGSSGIAVDVLREAAKRAGLRVQLLALPFAELHKAAFNGVAAAIFPVGINGHRESQFDFSDPLIMSGGALFTRCSEGDDAPTLESLSGKVVTTPGAGPLYDLIRQSSAAIRLLPSTNYEESFAQLIDGRADAAALNFHVGKTMIEQDYAGLVRAPSSTFVDLPMAVAVPRRARRGLIEKLNFALRQIRSEEGAMACSSKLPRD